MNRSEIKELAKSKIKGNKWNIIWPMLIIGVVGSILSRIFGGSVEIDFNNLESLTNIHFSPMYYFSNIVVSILTGLATAGYIKYILNFVRTGKFNTNDIFDTIKEKWLNCLIADILSTIIISLCSCLFVVPGIIMALAYAFVTFIVIDTDTAGSDSLKASREMMKGYKWNYFVFGLSFIGWFLLVPFTLGILLIWLYPYVTVAYVIYYDKLKEISKLKKD